MNTLQTLAPGSHTTLHALSLTGTANDIRRTDTGEHPYEFLSLYSLMKHGGAHAADRFAWYVYKAIVNETPELLEDPRPIVLPVSYVHVPPSCMFIAQGVAERLNSHRAELGLSPAEIVRVTKDSVAFVNYANSDQTTRQAEMGRVRLTLTDTVPEDAIVLLVDDVRVTGLTEKSIIDAVDPDGTHPVVCAYVAAVDDVLAAEPHVEAAMNLFHIRQAQEMLPHIQRGRGAGFNLTIRYLKRVLDLPAQDLQVFLGQTPDWFIRDCIAGAQGSGPGFDVHYAASLGVLYQEGDTRGLL